MFYCFVIGQLVLKVYNVSSYLLVYNGVDFICKYGIVYYFVFVNIVFLLIVFLKKYMENILFMNGDGFCFWDKFGQRNVVDEDIC